MSVERVEPAGDIEWTKQFLPGRRGEAGRAADDGGPADMRGVEGDVVARLGAVLETLVARLGNLGGLVGVHVEGRAPLILAAGHSDLERRMPLGADAVWMIASQTKTLTTITALKLARAGRLDLTAPVATLTGNANIDPTLIVEHLAMSQSGLGAYEEPMVSPHYSGGVRLEPAELVKLAMLSGPVFKPGAQFDYANINFVLLALVIETVTREPLARVVRREVLDPLGLEMWFAASEVLPVNRMAGGYFRSGVTPEPRHVAELDHSFAFGTGDMAASTATMLQLWAALMTPDNPIGITAADLIAKTGHAAGTPFHPLSLGVEYGYGVEVAHWAGGRVVGHPGRIQGYSSGSWADTARGVAISTCITGLYDQTEDRALTAARFPAAQLFTAALAAAYALRGNDD